MKLRTFFLFLSFLFLSLFFVNSVFAASYTELVSQDSFGNPGNSYSQGTSVSDDGRYVVFSSSSTNFPDGNGNGEVYLRDRENQTITKINSSGTMTGIFYPVISANGRYIAYLSIINGCGSCGGNIIVYDIINGTNEQITPFPIQGNGSNRLAISGDGRYIVYASTTPNIVPEVTSSQGDIYIYDRQIQTTRLVSSNSSGIQGNDFSRNPSISSNGRYVVFDSNSTNLVASNTNGVSEVFLKDTQTGITKIVSVDNLGNAANDRSYLPVMNSISGDGSLVLFNSRATNLGVNTGRDLAYIHNIDAGTTEMVSLNNSGAFPTDSSGNPAGSKAYAISANGRYIIIEGSYDKCVYPSFPCGIFIRDIQTGNVFPATIDNSGNFLMSAAIDQVAALTADGSGLVYSVGQYPLNRQIYFHHFDFNSLHFPTVTSLNTDNYLISLNSQINIASNFIDQDISDVHESLVDWGDGIINNGTVSENNGSGVITGNHSYSATGVYVIKLFVKDSSGLVGSIMYQYISVFDSNTSLSGGRSYINPSSAIPTTSGKIMFGINAKYDNSGILNGDFKMNFKIENLDFVSTTLTSLTSSNNKAYLTGTGVFNGIGNYSFLITAIDGHSTGGDDLIRIQIKDISTNAVVYDSQPGEGNTTDPITVVATGNIRVQ